MLSPRLDFMLTNYQNLGVSNYLRTETTKNKMAFMLCTVRNSGNRSTLKWFESPHFFPTATPLAQKIVCIQNQATKPGSCSQDKGSIF